MSSAFAQSGTYTRSIDGLRFFAFLLVLIHHSPKYGPSDILVTARTYGWAGVDLFFVISAYLLFKNLHQEHIRNGFIDTARYIKRRFLRIYPLLFVYTISMLLIFGPVLSNWPLRLAGDLLFFDNINSWFLGLNSSIRATAHLWTLSYEFQVYIVLPFILSFFLFVGRRSFIIYLILLSIAAGFLRSYLFNIGVEHPVIYVTPFLRPEAIFAGMVLAVYRPTFHWAFSLAVAVVAIWGVISLPVPTKDYIGTVYQYPLIAIAAAASLDVALRCPIAMRALGWSPFVLLGTVSYGLYVFHYFTRHVLRQLFAALEMSQNETFIHYLAFTGSVFLSALVLALLSYKYLEMPFLKMKSRNVASQSA